MFRKKKPTRETVGALADSSGQVPEEAQAQRPGAGRWHNEGLGRQWAVFLGNPEALMPQVVGTVLQAGATRQQWRVCARGQEYVLMAWPREEPLRASVIMRGPEDGELKPALAVPLLDGVPNDLTVEEVHPFASGVDANVGVEMLEEGKPLWFYNPLYFRDREDLTPGVTHTFVLAGLALGLRKALLDAVTITKGPDYEAHAARWLEQNPGKSRLDVPPLRINVQGQKIIMPGRCFAEYEMRNSIHRVEYTRLDQVECYILHLFFPFTPAEGAADAAGGTPRPSSGSDAPRPPIYLVVYVPRHLCGDYTPKAGDEVDMYVWLQGRVLDMPVQEAQETARDAPA